MVLSPEQKKKFLKIARPRLNKCISCDEEVRNEIRRGLKNGRVDEKVLSLFPDAYPGVLRRVKRGDPEPVLSYFLTEHNLKRLVLYKQTGREEYRKCLVVPGEVVGEKDGMLLIRAPDGVHTTRKRKGFSKGSKVLIHDGEVVDILTEKEYSKIKRMYERTLKSLES